MNVVEILILCQSEMKEKFLSTTYIYIYLFIKNKSENTKNITSGQKKSR